MSNLRFKKRMTKTAFEKKLVEEFGVDNLSAGPYVEDGKKLTLYYLDGIGHCGTWHKGNGWIFERAYGETA